MKAFGDDFILALCLWRESRGEGEQGMQAVANVVCNRVAVNGSSVYREVTKPWQFSSITAHNDPQLGLYPISDDPNWILAVAVAHSVMNGTLPDITNGATYYFNPSVVRPAWAADMQQTAQIGKHVFYKPENKA